MVIARERPGSSLRRAAVMCLAAGKTADDVRSAAMNPDLVAALAMARAESPQDVQGYLFAIAVAVEVVTAESRAVYTASPASERNHDDGSTSR